MATKEQVLEKLGKVLDPELGLDIVSLGFIYEIAFPAPDSVHVKMTLSVPGCPLVSFLTNEAKTVILELPDVKNAEIELVFDPPWSPDMITEETRKKLGL